MLLRGRRTTFLAPILSPTCVDGFSPNSHKLACSQAEVRVIEQYTLQHHNVLHNTCTTTVSLTFTQLHKPIFSRPWKVYLVITPLRLLLQQHASPILYPLYSSSAPAKPKFCNPYFSCFRPRPAKYNPMQLLWTRYFHGILGMFSLLSIYLFVCVYFSYKTPSLLRN